jgi:hypothetical protein
MYHSFINVIHVVITCAKNPTLPPVVYGQDDVIAKI